MLDNFQNNSAKNVETLYKTSKPYKMSVFLAYVLSKNERIKVNCTTINKSDKHIQQIWPNFRKLSF